jgi:hypothetical protein
VRDYASSHLEQERQVVKKLEAAVAAKVQERPAAMTASA